MRIRSFAFLPILLCGISMAGCGGVSDLSREDYRRGILFIQPLAHTKMVVLPMGAPRVNRPYVADAERIFYKALTEMQVDVEMVSPDESRDVPGTVFGNPAAERVVFEREMAPFQKRFGTPLFLQTTLTQVGVVEGATQVRILGRLWDVEQGGILWEAHGEARGDVFLFFPTAPASFERMAEAASRGLIRKLPSFVRHEPDNIP